MTKSTFLFTFPALLSALLCTACAGNQEPQMQDIAPFHHVFVNGRVTRTGITLAQAPGTYQIGIIGKHRDSLYTAVRNDTLFIDAPMGKRYSYDIRICAPEYRSFCGHLLKRFAIADTLRQDSMEFNPLDAKEADLKLCVHKLKFTPEIGEMRLYGTCDTAYFNAKYNSGFSLDASQLAVTDLHLKLHNAEAKLNVSGHLWLEDIFMAKIDYFGQPQVMECNLRLSKLTNTIFFY